MARFLKDSAARKGKTPGSLILIGQQKMDQPEIHVMDIAAEKLEEATLQSIQEASSHLETPTVSWINVWGIHDPVMMASVGELFRIQPMLMEDILNTDLTPTYDQGEHQQAIILKMIKFDREQHKISAEQISIIRGEHYVLTLQEQKGDLFTPVRERIRNTLKRTRFVDADYLTYALLDTIVEGYLHATEALGREIEALEERLFKGPDPKLIEEIHRLKTELSYLRKSIRPVRDIMIQLNKPDNTMFREKYQVFVKDLHEMVLQATDAVELYSSMLSDHLTIYSTNISNRTNEVMKVLTIFASIFIPLTFLAGIYGMNFTNIPELNFPYSYPIFWGISILLGVIMLLYFRRKKWL